MAWADQYIAQLKAGHTITFCPRGGSMAPHIHSGQQVTVRPLRELDTLAKGNIVLCKVAGAQYLHFVSAIQGDRVQIANARGHVNGWTARKNVFGIFVS